MIKLKSRKNERRKEKESCIVSVCACQYKLVPETLTPGDSSIVVGLSEPSVSIISGGKKNFPGGVHFLHCETLI